MLVVMFFLYIMSTTAQNSFIGFGVGKTSKGHSTASFWGRDFFFLDKAGLTLSPYIRITDQEYQATDICNSGSKVEHDEQVLGCVLNFNGKKHPGFEDLSLILALGRYNQREHRYEFTPDKDGYAIGSSYFTENEKKGISLETGMSWRFKFKKIKNIYGNVNYTANTYSLFITTIGVSVMIGRR